MNFFRCIYTREKNDSLISFLKEKTKLYNRYKLTDYFDHNTFNKGKVNIKLLELFSETKCGETFFLSKIKSSKIKNEFINEFENYKQNNKDEESLSYIKKIELYIEPSPLNIYQYLNNKKPQKRFINCLEIKNVQTLYLKTYLIFQHILYSHQYTFPSQSSIQPVSYEKLNK